MSVIQIDSTERKNLFLHPFVPDCSSCCGLILFFCYSSLFFWVEGNGGVGHIFLPIASLACFRNREWALGVGQISPIFFYFLSVIQATSVRNYFKQTIFLFSYLVKLVTKKKVWWKWVAGFFQGKERKKKTVRQERGKKEDAAAWRI